MTFKQYIDGEWVDAEGGGTWDLVNPATETVLTTVPFGDERDARRAVDAAAEAFRPWSRRTAWERGEVLERAADIITERLEEFARVLTEEAGKPFREALGEWGGVPNQLRWSAEEARRVYGRIIPARTPGRRIDVTYQPIGVVGIITAWNFPAYNQARAVGAALAAGCTVVSRPSEYTPRTAMLLARALEEAGLPAGVLNVINGQPHEMGQVLLDDPRVRKIHFTGSTRVGKLLMDGASRTVTQLSLELGGNSPVIIFPDAGDVHAIAKRAFVSKVRNNGQVCVSPQRFYVHESMVSDFTAGAVATAGEQVVGDGMHADTTVGPLINATQRERVERLVSASVAAGAQVQVGGSRPDGAGYFFEPTVLTAVEPGLPVHEEEMFGPVMPILPFEDLDAVIELANRTHYGLAAYVHTRDLATAMYVSDALEFGLVAVNDWTVSAPEAPFGGMKQSGLGRESGPEGVHEYLETKTRTIGGLL